jgi:hypothetical protein
MQLGNKRIKALQKQRQKLVKSLPDPGETIRGSLVKRFLPCGKQACRCHHGGPQHGPYYYLMTTLKAGKTQMVKLSADQVKIVREWVRNFKSYRKRLEKITEMNTRMLQHDRKTSSAKRMAGKRG